MAGGIYVNFDGPIPKRIPDKVNYLVLEPSAAGYDRLDVVLGSANRGPINRPMLIPCMRAWIAIYNYGATDKNWRRVMAGVQRARTVRGRAARRRHRNANQKFGKAAKA